MTPETPPSPPLWEDLLRDAEAGRGQPLEAYLDTLPGSEVARFISRLDEEEQTRVLTLLNPERAAELIEEIPDPQAVGLMEHLPAKEAAAILSQMASDQQADLLGILSGSDAEAILAEMTPEQASDLRRLAEYPPDVAGGLMITEFLFFPASSTVQAIVQELRRGADVYADYHVQYIYVVDASLVPVGVLRLRDLLLTPGSRTAAEIMIGEPVTARDDLPLDELAGLFDHYGFLAVPVTDARGALVGVVLRHDVEEALGGRADVDYLKSQGIVGGEELRTMPLLRRSTRRLSWLSINIILNIISASVIAIYQDTLSAVIALAVFLPIISDMSGCSGNQAVAVSMRELSLGLARPFDAMRVALKEITVGTINGLVLGALLGLTAWLWKGNPYLGLVIACAMTLNTIISATLGGSVPLVLKRMKMDPALASGPILTTITDMCGFLLVLGFATAMLSRLATG